MRRLLTVAGLAFVPAALSAQSPVVTPAMLARIDSVFGRYAAADGPGCALGVARRDSIVLERAWGSAQLEHGVPITPQTVFEAGSVSKQFTAAAILLLAERGRLSLTDDVRRYVPEVPDYGVPITIEHLIHHTSGLRDWGAVAAIGGWPRGSRVYTHAHVLEIIGRQRSLNNRPGAEYLYSNSNYNLLAIIVERVSGRSLADFTSTELFLPLGMTRSGWRDDFTRIVPGRAQAYSRAADGWRLEMPNEHIYGNSSLLTTVGDLLRWDAAVANGRLGAPFLAARERRGRLTNGFEIAYAAGVLVRDDPRIIEHNGATAGYRADLSRFHDAGWTVAVLCNAADVNPTGVGRAVIAIVSGTPPAPPPPPDTQGVAVAAARLAALAGRYASDLDHSLFRVEIRGATLRLVGGPPLVMRSDSSFTVGRGTTGWFQLRGGRVERITMAAGGDTVVYRPVEGPAADSAALAAYAGRYRSDEADVTVTLAVARGRLMLRRPPADSLALTGLYHDAFSAGGITFRFSRGRTGAVDGFGVTVTRARNVRFERVDAPVRGR